MRATKFATPILVAHIFMSTLRIFVAGQPGTDRSNEEKLSLEDALTLRYQKILKKEDFIRTKKEALKYIPKEVRPGKLIQEGNFTSVIMEYDGESMPLYILLIAMIPLVLAELCRLLWNLVRPKLKFQQEGGGEFPFTACYHLQETLREQQLKRPARNCTSWFVHQYILSIEDETLEWKDVIESLQVPQPIRKRKPWQTIRLIFRLKNALKRGANKEEEKDLDTTKPILAGNHIECHLHTNSSEETLNLESQISQLEFHYKTLNALEKDYEVPSPPHPELFTVRELMEFMTRDEKLLVLRCFDKGSMNQLMISCNIDEIRRKHAEFVQAHMEAAATVYDHVEDLKSKGSVNKIEAQGDDVENKTSIKTLFDMKDRLAKDIVDANEKLLEDWENSEAQNEVKDNLLSVLDPIHIQRAINDDNMAPEEILDNLGLDDKPDELKVKAMTSEERVDLLIKRAEYDIDDMEKRIKVKKRIRKKGKGKITKLNMKKNVPAAKEDGKKGGKGPFKWVDASNDKEEKIDQVPKLHRPEPVYKLKDRKEHVNLQKIHKMPEEETSKGKAKNVSKEKKKSADSGKGQDIKYTNEAGNRGRRRTNENGIKEKEERKGSANESEEKKKRRTSENEQEEKEKRKLSSNEPGEKDRRKQPGNEPGEIEKRKLSENETNEKEKPKLSVNVPGDKQHRKVSGDELPGEKGRRRTSGNKPDQKDHKLSRDEPGDTEYRKLSGNEPGAKEKRKISGEAGEKQHRKISGNEAGENEKRKPSGNEPAEKDHRKFSGEEPGEKEKLKISQNENQAEQLKYGDGTRKDSDKRKQSGEEEIKKTFENETNKKDEQRKLSDGEAVERERKRSSQAKRREKEHQRISENERIEKEKRKLSDKDDKSDEEYPENRNHGPSRTPDDTKKRRISEPEEGNEGKEIAIQTHHHHHHRQKLPTLMMGRHHPTENSHQKHHHRLSNDENPKEDINLVHDETVDNFFKKIEDKKDLTKSAEMAIKRDLIFQASEAHPQLKIYSQGRRAHFDAVQHRKATMPENTPDDHLHDAHVRDADATKGIPHRNSK